MNSPTPDKKENLTMKQEEWPSEAQNLMNNQVDEFQRHVASQNDPSSIVLKGHLLCEYFITELLILCDDKEDYSKLSFHQKNDALLIFLPPPQIWVHIALKRLNDVRNSLAHKLNFNVSRSDVDEIGYALGKEYIIKKWREGPDKTKGLLLFVLNKMLTTLTFNIYKRIEAGNQKN